MKPRILVAFREEKLLNITLNGFRKELQGGMMLKRTKLDH